MSSFLGFRGCGGLFARVWFSVFFIKYVVGEEVMLAATGPGSGIKHHGPDYHKVHDIPADSDMYDDLHGSATFFLTVSAAAKQHVYDEVLTRADPNNDLYGQWLSDDELCAIVAPSQTHIDTITAFLSPGLKLCNASLEWSICKDVVRFRAPETPKNKCLSNTIGVNISLVSPKTLIDNLGKKNFLAWKSVGDLNFPEKVAQALDYTSLNSPLLWPDTGEPSVFDKIQCTDSEPRECHLVGKRWGEPPDTTGAPSTPWPRPHPAGDKQLMLGFWVYCADGKISNSADCGGEIDLYHVTLTSHGRAVTTQSFSPESATAVQDMCGPKNNVSEQVPCVRMYQVVSTSLNYNPFSYEICTILKTGARGGCSGMKGTRRDSPQPYVTPKMLSRLYKTPFNQAIRAKGNIVSVLEFEGQYLDWESNAQFLKRMGINSKKDIKIVSPTGSHDNEVKAGSQAPEALLDVQYLLGIAPLAGDAEAQFWDLNSESFNMEFTNTVDGDNEDLLGLEGVENYDGFFHLSAKTPQDSLPKVVSVSYAHAETEVFKLPAFHDRANYEFAKMALRGVSVLAASGDAGANTGRNGLRYSCSPTPANAYHITFQNQ